MYITVVGDPDSCTWLKLAGVGEVYPIKDNQDSLEVLSNLWLREDITVIIVTPEVAEACRQEISEFMSKKLFPVIMELPLKDQKEKDSLTELVLQAVGIKLEI
ncbi:MAG: V-type ATP synthase subunit F [Candidatus Hodarchaeales archaeon]